MSAPVCTAPGCDALVAYKRLNLCSRHYHQLRRCGKFLVDGEPGKRGPKPKSSSDLSIEDRKARPWVKAAAECKRPFCSENAVVDGFCFRHSRKG